jgi:hypothetical protein
MSRFYKVWIIKFQKIPFKEVFVNRHILKRSFVRLAVSMSALALPLSASAAPNTAIAPVVPTASSALDECSKELLLSYFPQTYVNNSLKKFNIPEDKWAGINRSLASKDKEIVKMVEQKASAINPNPLKDPQQRQAAVKLFRDTLFEVFSAALHENGVQQTDQLHAILDDIQQQKAKKFAECMERHKAQLDKNRDESSDNSNSDDEDGDDEDAEDDEDDSDDASTTNSTTNKDQVR